MRLCAAACLVIACVAFGAAPAFAHEVTSKGTVVSVDTSKADEKAVVVHVATVSDKASETGDVTFYLDPKSEIFRGEARVTFEQVTFTTGEPVTIVVDHDLDEHLAMEVHLEPKP